LANGGIFGPTNKSYKDGEDSYLILTLMDDPTKYPPISKIAWVTPAGANNSKAQGIGVHFSADESGQRVKNRIEELLGAALEFERNETPSLDRFLAWFARGDVEIKRDPSAPTDAVRVMTVHGAKGLDAPIVILADATADPDKLGPSSPPVEGKVQGVPVPQTRPHKTRSGEARCRQCAGNHRHAARLADVDAVVLASLLAAWTAD